MKPTLLIVDDIKAVREKLRDAFEEEFEVVGLAASGDEALALCGEYTPNLVLMDLVMPKMSGIEATAAIMKQVLPAPKIVVVSALHNEDIVLRALEAGAAEYLVKPVSERKIREVLKMLVQEAA